MSPAPPTEAYAEIRRRLRERGYLDGRIERFVLDERRIGARGPRQLLRASARAALLGAPLLGGLLALSAAVLNRPLGPADLALLWLYFGVLAALVLFVLDATVATVLALVARSRGVRRGDAVVAALAVAVPVLGYLCLLWWRRRGAGSLWGDGLFALGTILTTLLVGWLAGLVSVAGIVGRTGQVPGPRRLLIVALSATLVPLTLLAVTARGVLSAGPEHPPPRFSTVPAAPLLVLGIDGLDAELLAALGERGAMPRIAGALAGGAARFDLAPGSGDPAADWTTLMTGLPARRHGVDGPAARRLPGVGRPLRGRTGPLPLEAALGFLLPASTVPASAALRRERTLWEIVALQERSVGVGWWASWPAGSTDGFVVTDRVLPKLLAGAAPDRDTAPASLFSRLRTDFPADRAAIEGAFAVAAADGPLAAALWQSYLIDGWNCRIGARLAADPEVRATFVYLPGLDILRHRLSERPVEATALLGSQAALETYAGLLDGLVGEALDRAPGRIVLIGDPGRSAGPARRGIVALVDDAALPGCRDGLLGRHDLAPLLLGLAGFPASREMPGRAPAGCATPGGHLRAVEGFGRRTVDAEPPFSDYDAEMVERLKSLGYLD